MRILDTRKEQEVAGKDNPRGEFHEEIRKEFLDIEGTTEISREIVEKKLLEVKTTMTKRRNEGDKEEHFEDDADKATRSSHDQQFYLSHMK